MQGRSMTHDNELNDLGPASALLHLSTILLPLFLNRNIVSTPIALLTHLLLTFFNHYSRLYRGVFSAVPMSNIQGMTSF
jgi:hypothetical protein